MYGLVCLVLMPKSPASVFLLDEREQRYITRALIEDDVASETTSHSGFFYEMRRALVQPHVLLTTSASFFTGM